MIPKIATSSALISSSSFFCPAMLLHEQTTSLPSDSLLEQGRCHMQKSKECATWSAESCQWVRKVWSSGTSLPRRLDLPTCRSYGPHIRRTHSPPASVSQGGDSMA